MENIKSFIQDTQKNIQENNFKPMKYTDPRDSRTFSLLPLYDCVSKSIQIDKQAFLRVIKTSTKKTNIPKNPTENDITDLNIIQTNGHSVEFTFKKKAAKKSQSKATKGLTPKDFENEVKNNEAVVWGADPGVTEIYTAVDSGCTQDKERIRKTSTKEYYHNCDYNNVKATRMKHQNENQRDFEFISGLPFLKTNNEEDCFYNWSIKENFKSYIKKQKATHEIAKSLFPGSKKYNSTSTLRNKMQKPNKENPVLSAPKDNNQTDEKRKLHAVLKCDSCNTVWNRDVMAVKNIHNIFTYMSQHNSERPPEFRRRSNEPTPPKQK
ncbi:hypothetical protein EDC94DRAFT_670893 [Helicostylum pulchrum]|nr:hypothetical protein EDC94DRAFT_670893 [Helicostylum pulchrum]